MKEEVTVAPAGGADTFDVKAASILMGVLEVGLALWMLSAEYGVFDPDVYQFYMGVAIMMLVGFGYLMTFLKMYGLGAVGFTFMLTCLCIQFNILLSPLFLEDKTPYIDAMTIMDGNFAAATVLITLGAVIGKASPLQLVVMALLESVLFQANRHLLLSNVFHLEDIGGTVAIHLFGAYFGLGVTYIMGFPADKFENEGTTQTSDIFSLIGTVFLWLYWPSFNGGGVTHLPDQEIFVVANTIIALTFSCVISFVVSGILTGAFRPVDVQNATLAGGVCVGASARMAMHPAMAALIGIIAGVISVLGYQKIHPKLADLGIHDTCGVHNLHGMPAVVGGLLSSIIVVYTRPSFIEETGVPFNTQAWYQVASVFSTLAISVVGGLLTGVCLKLIKDVRQLQQSDKLQPFADQFYWEVA